MVSRGLPPAPISSRPLVRSSSIPHSSAAGAGLDARTAADITWLHIDPDNYRALTVEGGWSETAYQRWLADTLTGALLPPQAP